MSKKLLRLEIVGILFYIVVGSFLHFTFALSGNFFIVAFFSAVNESVWEHLKLAFFPIIFWALIEKILVKKEIKNFWAAKAFASIFAPLFIIFGFYAYTSILGTHSLSADIILFILSVVFAGIVSVAVLRSKRIEKAYSVIALSLIIFLALVFIVFTFNPLRLPIFMNPVSGN